MAETVSTEESKELHISFVCPRIYLFTKYYKCFEEDDEEEVTTEQLKIK